MSKRTPKGFQRKAQGSRSVPWDIERPAMPRYAEGVTSSVAHDVTRYNAFGVVRRHGDRSPRVRFATLGYAMQRLRRWAAA